MVYPRSIPVLLVAGLACGPSSGAGSEADEDSTGGGPSADDTTTGGPGASGGMDGGSPTSVGTSVGTTDGDEGPSTITDPDGTSDSSSGGSFITPPDWGGGGCSGALQCDLFAQDCPVGEKCMPWDCAGTGEWNGQRCSPLDPNPAQVGEPCQIEDYPLSGLDDCDLGLMCWDPDPRSLTGTCQDMCTGSGNNPICENGEDACLIAFEGSLVVCVPSCDPLAPDCPGTQACVTADAELFVCMPDAVVEADAYGDDCSDAFACGTGLLCRPDEHVPGCAGTDCCTTLGSVADPPTCPDPAQTCLPLGLDAPPPLSDLCFCGIEP